MKPEAQRIAIAEACGWKQGEGLDTGRWLPTSMSFYQTRNELPNYLNDLNAMHDAWWSLETTDARIRFKNELRTIIAYPGISASAIDIDCLCENATAAQRARAFLKTIGRWNE